MYRTRALTQTAAETMVEVKLVHAVFVKAYGLYRAGLNALSAVRAFALFIDREIRAVVIDERDVELLFQRERHAAAGAAEAEIILIRLDAGFNDRDKPVLVRHIRDREAFINADTALTGLLFQLTVEIKPEAGVYGIVAMPLHRAAHAGRHGNIRRIADYILCLPVLFVSPNK